MNAVSLRVSSAEFLEAVKGGQDYFDQVDRKDGKTGDGFLDIEAYAAKVEDGIAQWGKGADDQLSTGVIGLRTAAYNSKMLGLGTADKFERASELVEEARARGWERFANG